MLTAFVAIIIGWSAPTEAAKRPITYVADPGLTAGPAENFRELFVDPRRVKRSLQPIGNSGNAGAGAKVTKDAIEISDRVFFSEDGHTVKPSSLRILDAVASVLKKRPDIASVEIRGFANGLGSQDKNLAVSVRRTKAVVDYLVSKGISTDRLASVGFGDSTPEANGQPLQFRIQQWKDVPGMNEVSTMDAPVTKDDSKTGTLIISNDAQTSAIVSVNGTKIGVVGPYTDAALHGLSSGVYDVAITHPTGYTRYNAQRTQPRSEPIVPGGARAVQSLPNKGLPVTTDADQNAAQ